MRDHLYQDMIKARKEKDKDLLAALSLAWADITATEKAERCDKLADARFVAIINKLIKQDKETLESFQKRGDQENSAALEKRIAIYEAYLPQQLSDAELAAIVDAAIAAAPENPNMGAIMKAVTPQVSGRVEMSRVSALVKSRLSGH